MNTSIRNTIIGNFLGFLLVMGVAAVAINSPARDVVYPPERPVELNVDYASVERPAHTDSQANAGCDWLEVSIWGAPNNIVQIENRAVHLWGGHQAHCIFSSILNNDYWCWLIDLNTGQTAYRGQCLG